jgi:Ni/Co efflux regulator RcnB
MRKLIILGLIAATAMPGAVMAQSRGEVRDSARDLRQEQRELRDAERYGSRHDVREQRRDVRDARQELREDWRDYRRSHWRAPFRYNRWEAGSQLRPSYYSSRYYISDPYRYRLPRPNNPNLRWVRHYNDVLLVNVRSGRVMEVHRGFFW